jgi:hypothetical protein
MTVWFGRLISGRSDFARRESVSYLPLVEGSTFGTVTARVKFAVVEC